MSCLFLSYDFIANKSFANSDYFRFYAHFHWTQIVSPVGKYFLKVNNKEKKVLLFLQLTLNRCMSWGLPNSFYLATCNTSCIGIKCLVEKMNNFLKRQSCVKATNVKDFLNQLIFLYIMNILTFIYNYLNILFYISVCRLKEVLIETFPVPFSIFLKQFWDMR